jgi:cell division transport system ATP-binding protein
MIQFYGVTKIYGRKAALTDVTARVGEGEFVFIVGPSGAGKTTLLKLILCQEPVSRGEVLVDRQNLKRLRPHQIPELRRKIGVVFQDFKLLPTRTVYQNVALRLEIQGARRGFIQKKVRVLLRNLGLESLSEAYPPQLSGGEQQRVSIARAMIGDPRILLADEPTGNLDLDMSRSIFELLLNINRGGATVLMATHNRELLKEANLRILQLDKGRLVA